MSGSAGEGLPENLRAAPVKCAMPPEEGSPLTPVVAPHSNLSDHCGASKSGSASAAKKPRNIGAYAVQCAECLKLRLIPTIEEYQVIRQNFTEDPWVCKKRPSGSCDEPADLEFDATELWVVDKPGIPKTPAGCKRVLIMRTSLSKLDAHYVMPNGKRVRSSVDVDRFLEAYPEYKSQLSVSDFRFSVPKVMEGKFPGETKHTVSTRTRKRKRKSKLEE